MSKIVRIALLALGMAAAPSPGCVCIEVDACLKFCGKVVDECKLGGCTCSIDRCKNSLDVADALNKCYELSCTEYVSCANQAVALCELKDEFLDAGQTPPPRDAATGVDTVTGGDSWIGVDAALPDVPPGTDAALPDTARADLVVTPCAEDNLPCEDGLWCTVDDRCLGGECQPGAARDCDEGIACTVDTCVEWSQSCEHATGVPTPGLEGYAGDPTCSNNLDDDCDGFTDAGDTDCWLIGCASPGECPDDSNECTETRCDRGYCEHLPLPVTTSCSGSNACTTRFHCQDAVCVPGPSTLDGDSDGAIADSCPGGLDCADGDPGRHPGAEGPAGDPSCSDDVDNDCDALTDRWDPSCWPPSCTADGFCRESPLPQGNNLTGVFAAAADDVWAVGLDGLLLHWDGSGWTPQALASAYDFNAIHGCAADDVWAVAGSGVVLRWNGQDWTLVPNSNRSELNGIWCVGGTTPTQAWTSTSRDYALHWDGAAWETIRVATDTWMYGIWAPSGDEAWVIGRSGSLSHYNRNSSPTVEHIVLDTPWTLSSIWGDSGEIWVGGNNGYLFHNRGTGWLDERIDSGGDIDGLWGSSSTDVWGVTSYGAPVIHSTGSSWTLLSEDPLPPSLADIWGTASNDVWAVGQGGAMAHWDGATWSTPGPSYEYLLTACAIEQLDGSVDGWAAGDVVMRWDGSQWREHPAPIWRVYDLFCRGSEDIWAVGNSGGIAHWDGLAWSEHEGVTQENLLAVAGLAAGSGEDVWAVGDIGVILRWDGSAWGQEASPSSALLHDVWATGTGATTQVWVVGAVGTVLFWDARGWQPMSSGVVENLRGVWGDGLGQLWAVGENGTVLRWAGAGWNPVTDHGYPSVDFTDVWGASANSVWLASRNALVHWNGAVWSLEETGGLSFESIAGTASGHMWLVGGYGGVVHRAP